MAERVAGSRRRWSVGALATLAGLGASRIVAPAAAGLDAEAWYRGDEDVVTGLAREMIAFEAADDANAARPSGNRFEGEWALVTHQMVALGLAQICLAHPEWKEVAEGTFKAAATRAATKSFRPTMRGFGTRAWGGEDVLASLGGPDGHAYFAYPALAVGMARLVNPAFPAPLAREHDAVVAAFARRLLASPTGLIETYPGEAYPTDVAAVAASIAVHDRVTHTDHGRALRQWADRVRDRQIDRASGFVIQRMGARDGRRHDEPRGSGTAFAAYYAGFVDRGVASLLADGTFRHETTFFGFGGIREYDDGRWAGGDVDSGPVVLGLSVSATGFSLAPARAHRRHDSFVRAFRSASLFGIPVTTGSTRRFALGGPFGNALLLAFLTSGPELAP